MKKFILFLFLIPNILNAGSIKAIGEKGKISEVSRVIQINMYDNYYEPDKIEVKKGETIKFFIKNLGELVHEFNIATKMMHLEHQPKMMTLVENEIILSDKIDKQKMIEMVKKNPSMSHTHSNSVLLSPGESGNLIWKFTNSVKLEAACNVPGHYEAGMIAEINNL